MFTWKVNDLNSRSKNFLGLWPAVLLGEFLPVGEQRNKASVTVQRTFWANKDPKSPDSRFWQEVPTCHQNSACSIPNFFYFPLWLIPTELDLCELLWSLKLHPLMLLVHSLQQEVGIGATCIGTVSSWFCEINGPSGEAGAQHYCCKFVEHGIKLTQLSSHSTLVKPSPSLLVKSPLRP
jgi:hypothetical protein